MPKAPRQKRTAAIIVVLVIVIVVVAHSPAALTRNSFNWTLTRSAMPKTHETNFYREHAGIRVRYSGRFNGHHPERGGRRGRDGRKGREKGRRGKGEQKRRKRESISQEPER